MDKALLDFEVSIDADCKLLTVGKPFAIEGTLADWLSLVLKASRFTSNSSSMRATVQLAASSSHYKLRVCFFFLLPEGFFLFHTPFYVDLSSDAANDAMVSVC